MTLKEALERAKQAAYEPGAKSYPLLGAQLLERRGKVVDLTRPVYEGLPMWFGHQKPFFFTHQDHETFKRVWKTDCGFYARDFLISEHTGTHVDGINEYDPEGPPVDEVPLEFFWGEAVCLNMSHVKFVNPDPEGQGYAGVAEIQRAEAELAEHGEQIRAGDIALLWYDNGDRLFPRQEFLESYPGLRWDGAEYLAKKGVVNIGTDNLAVDNALDVQFTCHMVCKKYGITNTENLTNLDQVLNKRFVFFGLPLKLVGGTGSPIRAIAYLPPN
jgi:kynurenine formamidase